MEHDAYTELTAAYALDALDEADVRAYGEHLAGCEQCQNELAALSATAVSLAYAAPPVDPPELLRGRILDAARAERQNVVPLRRRPSRTGAAMAGIAAAAACLLIGLGIWNASLSRQLDDARSALQAVPLEGANGAVVVGGDEKGVLVISSLPEAPAGKTYEAWVIKDDAATPAGTFAGGGTVTVSLEHPVASGSMVAVTVEPEGGVEQPTSAPIITSAPV
jgi:anti-sigma factor RsiW